MRRSPIPLRSWPLKYRGRFRVNTSPGEEAYAARKYAFTPNTTCRPHARMTAPWIASWITMTTRIEKPRISNWRGFLRASPAIDASLPATSFDSTPLLVQAMFWMNGATVIGHYDAGIYTTTGNRVLSTGSTAQVTANALQVVSVAPTLLPPGPYYLALATATRSSTIFRTRWANTIDGAAYGSLQVDSAATGPVMP